MLALGKIFHRYTPGYFKKLIDPVTASIDRFVISSFSGAKYGSLVLDAGAGECRFRDKIGRNIRYIALDTALGDQTWDYSKIDVMSQLEHLPFHSQVFDSIICTQVLEHVCEPQLVLKEFFRTLREDGMIFLTAPQGWGVHQAPYDYYRYTNFGLCYLLRKAGFKVITIKPSCGYFGYLANRLTIFPKILFWQIKNKWVRLVLLPCEFISYFFFVLFFPLILNAIDFMDNKRNYTLNYFVTAQKKIGSRN